MTPSQLRLLAAAAVRRQRRQALLDSEVVFTATAAAFCGKEGASLLNQFRSRLKAKE